MLTLIASRAPLTLSSTPNCSREKESIGLVTAAPALMPLPLPLVLPLLPPWMVLVLARRRRPPTRSREVGWRLEAVT